LEAPLLALIALAIPSLLAGAYAGIQAIDPVVPAAARALGMTSTQVVLTVEVPLALPVIIGGLRSATLQVVATATLAAYVSDIGLGRYLFTGLKSRDYPEMLGGALAVVTLTLLLEVTMAALQRLVTRHITAPIPRLRLTAA
jgi:osmoprotectant transport system permease protein